MDNFEFIERLVNLENQLNDLERFNSANFILYLVLIIGSALFFFGSLFILIHLNNKYGDL